MSIDPTKMGGGLGLSSLQKRLVGAPDKNRQKFDQTLDRAVNYAKVNENSQLQAIEYVKFSQLRLLQGLFSIDAEEVDEGVFSAVREVDLLGNIAAQKSHILDKYYSTQQPSLLKPEQTGRSEIDQMIDRVAKKFSLAPELIHSVVAAESAYNPVAVSHVGAQGLMQLMPETAEELGVQDSFDPLQNLLGGSKYLKQLLDKYDGDLDSALAAYNWGQGNVDRHGLEKMPTETRNYLAKIKSRIGIQST